MRVLSWNLFHGRDRPPDPALLTWRSRLLRVTESNETHVQVNRELREEFAAILGGPPWDVALLQECPPRWLGYLERACEATSHAVLTSRNWLAPLSGGLARLNPDLIASWEGGSNAILVRGRLGPIVIVERRELTLRRLPERRRLAFVRLAAGPSVANLHASERQARAEEDVRAAAGAALDWTAGAPLLLGGDLNLRPSSSDAFERLATEHGLRAPTAPEAIDHLLVRGMEVVDAPRAWPPEARELARDGLALRLSDHAPVEGAFGPARAGR
jgi:endonuclease/exonuclease/phosphatase family metal-dependent hydrolase